LAGRAQGAALEECAARNARTRPGPKARRAYRKRGARTEGAVTVRAAGGRPGRNNAGGQARRARKARHARSSITPSDFGDRCGASGWREPSAIWARVAGGPKARTVQSHLTCHNIREYSIPGLSDTLTIKEMVERQISLGPRNQLMHPGNQLAPSSTRMLPEAHNKILNQDEKRVLIDDKHQVIDSLSPDRSRFHSQAISYTVTTR